MVIINKDLIEKISLVCASIIFFIISIYYYNKFGDKAWPVITCCFVFISFALGTKMGEWSERKKYEIKKDRCK